MSVVLTWFHKSTIPVFMSCLNCVGSFLLYLNLYILPKPSSFYRYNCRGSSSVHTALGFIRCKGLLSRLILRLEVHSLQILPFRERVIGRESRRMKQYRQPFTASIKFQGGSDGKEPTRGKRKNVQHQNSLEMEYNNQLSENDKRFADEFSNYVNGKMASPRKVGK